MEKILEGIKTVFRSHKKKMFIFLCGCLFFIVVLFPFGDLSDYISSQISAGTNNSVYVQFDDLSFTMMPQPGLKMSNVLIESAAAPELEFDSLSVAPSPLGIISLIKGKPAGRAYAEGLFSGDLDVAVSGSRKLQDDSAMSIDLEYENLDLKSLIKTLQKTSNIPFTMTGLGQIGAEIDVAMDMKVQPDGTFNVELRNPNIPAFSLPLGNFGDFPLPGLQLDQLTLIGTLKDGRLTIKDSTIGSNKNDLYGKLTGVLDVQFGPGFQNNRFGLYDFNVDLTLSKSLQSQFSIISTLLEKYERKTLTGFRYIFKAKGQGFQQAPTFTNL